MALPEGPLEEKSGSCAAVRCPGCQTSWTPSSGCGTGLGITGYLRTNPQVLVRNRSYIEIIPAVRLGANRFVWDNRTVIINDRPWGRSWVNRPAYVHPYEVRRDEPARRMESHELHQRSER